MQHRWLLTYCRVNLILECYENESVIDIFQFFFLRTELLLHELLEIYERLLFLNVANNSKMYIEHPVLQINSVCKTPFTWISPSKLAAHFPSPITSSCVITLIFLSLAWSLPVFKYSSVMVFIVWPFFLAKLPGNRWIHLEHDLFSI